MSKVCKHCGSYTFYVKVSGFRGVVIDDDGDYVYTDQEDIKEDSGIFCTDCDTEIDIEKDTITEDEFELQEERKEKLERIVGENLQCECGETVFHNENGDWLTFVDNKDEPREFWCSDCGKEYHNVNELERIVNESM